MKPHFFAQRSGQQISLPNFRLAYLNFRNAYLIFKSSRLFWDQVGIPENHERANPYKLIPYDLGCILKFVIERIYGAVKVRLHAGPCFSVVFKEKFDKHSDEVLVPWLFWFVLVTAFWIAVEAPCPQQKDHFDRVSPNERCFGTAVYRHSRHFFV